MRAPDTPHRYYALYYPLLRFKCSLISEALPLLRHHALGQSDTLRFFRYDARFP